MCCNQTIIIFGGSRLLGIAASTLGETDMTDLNLEHLMAITCI
jgi:hypothetical protein